MSRADMPIPAPGPEQSSVVARRTAHGIQDSDNVPSARATSGAPLCLPPESTAAARTHSQRSRWSRFATGCRYIDPAWTPSSQTPKFGKRQSSLSSELRQQLPAFMILQSSTGALPLQQLANRASDLCHPQSGKLRCDLPHQLQFMAVERAPTKGQGVLHGIGLEGGFSAV